MAIQNIVMPQLGESVTEGTIERWLVKPGDKVNKYDPLAEVNTDKVNAEIPSSFAGIVGELIANEEKHYLSVQLFVQLRSKVRWLPHQQKKHRMLARLF